MAVFFFEPRLMGLGLRQAQPPDGPRFGHEPGLMRLGLRQAIRFVKEIYIKFIYLKT